MPDKEDAVEEKQVSPWPILRQVSNDECWESMTKADLDILGVDSRQEWEKRGYGNPCQDPRKKGNV